MVQQLVWVRHRPGWYDNWGSLVCPWVTWPYIPGNAIPLAADPSLAGADTPVAGTAAGIAAAVDTEADRTGVVVGHMEVGHTAAAAGTEADRTEVVVDHTGSDTAAAVAGIAQTA